MLGKFALTNLVLQMMKKYTYVHLIKGSTLQFKQQTKITFCDVITLSVLLVMIITARQSKVQ